MNKLPRFVKYHLFSFLNYESLGRLMRTNKENKGIVKDYFSHHFIDFHQTDFLESLKQIDGNTIDLWPNNPNIEVITPDGWYGILDRGWVREHTDMNVIFNGAPKMMCGTTTTCDVGYQDKSWFGINLKTKRFICHSVIVNNTYIDYFVSLQGSHNGKHWKELGPIKCSFTQKYPIESFEKQIINSNEPFQFFRLRNVNNSQFCLSTWRMFGFLLKNEEKEVEWKDKPTSLTEDQFKRLKNN
eukprot:TRINITY_DN2387_c0_g1_i2.p1 TRINITY_DN2387_c0_g1~~TRINITY_DN2387_c0_g1_i2.p1  ORF type:complete len:249 (-),score=46.21 TRINITY_DN2387_c0_g1_i2:31-756(-)